MRYVWLYRGEPEARDYFIDKSRNGRFILRVKCPKCGKWGVLVKRRKGLLVRHEVGGCYHGWTTEHYDVLYSLYIKYIRLKRRLGWIK